MARIIKVSLNLSKIDKKRIVVGEKTGNKYIDIILVETRDNKYGQWMVQESVSKDERSKGIKGNVLGNGKNMGNEWDNSQSKSSSRNISEDDIPY